MLSCLYEGHVRHRRSTPAEHQFRYGLFLVYLDLDELPELLRGGYGLHRSWFSPASFCRADHLGDPAQPLAEAVRAGQGADQPAAGGPHSPADSAADLRLLLQPSQPVLLL